MESQLNNYRQAMTPTTPDLQKFMATDIYKEIRASSGLASHNPDDRWNLVRALQQRENGLASPHSASFSKNQQRTISNLFIPNKMSARLMSLGSKVFMTKFNRSGSMLLTACQDEFVRIYDGAKGTYPLLKSIRTSDLQHGIIDADFSPNGQHFAYSTLGHLFYIVPVEGSEDNFHGSLSQQPNIFMNMYCLRYSPTGDKLVGAGRNSTISVTDIRTLSTEILRTHRSPGMEVNSVCFLHDTDPNVLIGGCEDGVLKVYDLRTNWPSVGIEFCLSVASFLGHKNGVTYIDSRNDGYHVLSNSMDQSIKVWDVRVPSNRGGLLDFNNPNKQQDSDTSIMTYRGHRVNDTLLRAKFSPLEQTGHRYIYTGCATGRIIIYDVLTGKIKEDIGGHGNVVRDLDWHPERAEIVSGSWDTHVHLNTFSRSDPENRPFRRPRCLENGNSTAD